MGNFLNITNRSWIRLSKEGQRSPTVLIEDKTVFKIGTASTYICRKN